MRAVGYTRSLPIDDPAALEDIEVADPVPDEHDLLVAVEAISVNPIDTKVRMRAEPESGHKILGFDAAGTVRAVGPAVTLFKPGDKVFYAGDVSRQGTNAELHTVDERIVGPWPKSLGVEDAAALPLTSITAWEILFDKFRLPKDGSGKGTLLVMGGAGGVGSMMIQLAKVLAGVIVVASASREETVDWCRQMGADHIVNHREPLKPQLDALGLVPDWVASLTGSDKHYEALIQLVKPRGEIAMIDDPGTLDLSPMKRKAITFHWESMFARPVFRTPDMIEQHRLLTEVSRLVDEGRIRSTRTRSLGRMTAPTLREAHRLQESGTSIGKTVLTIA